MALQGTLETFSIPEVLRLLGGTRKTGLLALEGDRGSGKVWLRAGRIVAARSAHEPEGEIEPVLFDMLRFTEGSFVFETGADYDGDAPADADVESALLAAEELLAEWREIELIVPSLRAWVSMVPALTGESVTVSAQQWAALAIIGRGTSGHRLGDELRLGELDASRRIRDLVEAGLVEVDDTPVDGIDDPDDPITDLGEDGTWTTQDDLSVGLAGFVTRSAEEERIERAPEIELPIEEPLVDDDAGFEPAATSDDEFAMASVDHDVHDGVDVVDDFDDFDPADSEVVDETGAPEPDAGEEDEDVAEDLADYPAEPAPVAADEESDEFLSQLANLSPKAAAAIEATASAEETSARRLPSGEGDEEINRNLLLKFLSSSKP